MSDFGRIDFTYWPATGACEFHGHPADDVEGNTPPQRVSPTVPELDAAIAALQAERQQRIDAAKFFDSRRKQRVRYAPRHDTRGIRC